MLEALTAASISSTSAGLCGTYRVVTADQASSRNFL